MDNCVSLFASALIGQAVEDYVRNKKRVLRIGTECCDWKAESIIAECANFFRSELFATLSDLNPEQLINLCDEKARCDVQKRKRGTKKIFVKN